MHHRCLACLLLACGGAPAGGAVEATPVREVGAEPAPRPPELAGTYTDGTADDSDDSCTHDQRSRWLWLRTDGTYLYNEPGWTIEAGHWTADTNAVRLEPEELARGTGGGSIHNQILGVICRSEPITNPEQRDLQREGTSLRTANETFVRWREQRLSLANTWPICTEHTQP